jgi:hypothetical protein
LPVKLSTPQAVEVRRRHLKSVALVVCDSQDISEQVEDKNCTASTLNPTAYFCSEDSDPVACYKKSVIGFEMENKRMMTSTKSHFNEGIFLTSSQILEYGMKTSSVQGIMSNTCGQNVKQQHHQNGCSSAKHHIT